MAVVRRLVGCGLLLAAILPTNAHARQPADAGAGQWLLDHARHLALETDSTPSVGQVRSMLVWLQAATRIDPTLGQAYRAQRDLLLLLGRGEQAFDALKQYCRHQTTDHAERLAYLTQAFDRLQTADQRADFCRSHLQEPDLPPPLASELHRLLAETLSGIGDLESAKSHARQAVEAYRFNFTARRLQAELDSRPPAPHQQVEFLLTSISATPHHPQPMWQLALFFDSLSLHDQAQPWYARAGDLLSANSDGRPPFELQWDAARSLRDAGHLDRLLAWCEQNGANADERFLLDSLIVDQARSIGRDDLVQSNLLGLGQRIAELEEQVQRQENVELDVRIAWYYIHTDPAPEKALKFSEQAIAAQPDDPTVQRVRGLALVLAQRWADARAVLGPLCAPSMSDQWAGWGLARALVGLGKDEDALIMLRDAEQLRRSGPAYERVVELLEQLGQAPLPRPEHSPVLSALDAFDARVLDFAKFPQRFCELSVVPVNPHPHYAEPWLGRVTLTNRGPFAITIGPGQMIDGNLLVSAKSTAPQPLVLDGYLTESLALRPMLEPGQRMEVTLRLDVGPVADLALASPQREIVVTFDVTLDPISNHGRPSGNEAMGKLTDSVAIVRPAFRYDRAGAAGLSANLRASNPADRCRVFETVSGLLVERLAVMRKPADYAPVRIDRHQLQEVLLAGVKDPDPAVRARTIRALARLPFETPQVQAVAPLLSDPHWLVRLVAVDVLASQQGQVFKRVAERLAKSDPDALVKELAGLHLERMGLMQVTPPTSAQPGL